MPTKKNGKPGAELRYVPCRVQPGMFRGEFLAYVDGFKPFNSKEPVQAQLFVDERDVAGIQGTPERGRPVPAWLVVSLVRTGRGLAQVVLPQPAQPLGENLLVAEDMMREEVAT